MKNLIVAGLMITAMGIAQSAFGDEPREANWGLMEQMRPDQLEAVLEEAPIAFVPLGTYEHHGWHLPVGFDAIKVYAISQRVAQRTGGVVLPPFFYGTGGGHVDYKWTVILPEEQIRPIIETTLDHLSRFGVRVVVILTGHYPREQVEMVHTLAEEAASRNPHTQYIGLSEAEVTTPLPGDTRRGDHAAKYETSIALALNPAWVRLESLREGRDPDQVTTPQTPRRPTPTHDPTHPLYAIYGQDPREHASSEAGRVIVAGIVDRLAEKIRDALPRSEEP